MDISLLVVIGYLAGVTLIGILLMRRSKGSSDWAVAGGGMGMMMVAFGIAGTRIGGAGTYGVAGDVMSGGVWNMWWYAINTFLALAIVGLFFALPFRRLKLHTVGEVFTIRFGTRRCQWLTSFCVQTEYFIVNIIEVYVTAAILNGLTGMGMAWGCAIGAIVIISYTALGGLWGTAFTNLIHCAVIIFGLLLVVTMGISRAGGWDTVVETVNGHLAGAQRDSAAWWSMVGAGWGAVLAMFFSAAIHTPAASVYVNYASSARNERDVIPGFLIAGTFAAIMPFLAGAVGILTIAEYGVNTGTRGYTNLTKLATEIHPVVGGVALAAVLAAVISSGGPILLSSATMFVRDWLPFTNGYSSDQKLRAYRIVTVIYGLISAVIAWAVSFIEGFSVLGLLLFGFAMVVPPAIALGFLLYWRRTTEAGAYWGMLLGYGAGLLWFGGIKWAEYAGFTVAEGDSALRRVLHWAFVNESGEGVDPSYATTFVPFVAVPLISLLTAQRTENRERFYSIVRGREDAGDMAIKA